MKNLNVLIKPASWKTLSLIFSFLKVGIIGFGGGSALIPTIENELVVRKKAMSPEAYARHTVISNITPGALPVKLGATCGYELGGTAASVLSAYSVALPGTLLTVLILALFSKQGESALAHLRYASVGITVFIVFLLINYTIRIINTDGKGLNLLLCGASLLLTCGGKARAIVEYALHLPRGALGTPVFNLSVIHVMIISFYLIITAQLAKKKRHTCASAVLALLYAISCGTLAAARLPYFLCPSIMALLVASAIYLWAVRLRADGRKKRITATCGSAPQPRRRRLFACAVLFMAIPVLMFLIMAFSGILPELRKSGFFLGNVLASAVSSFGGGEAYIAVADSVFVQGGFIDGGIFYGRIVPVSNALPGPILIKVACAIGFVFGESQKGAAGGAALAALAMLASVGACCCVAMPVLFFYDSLKDSEIVRSVRRYILPVICGTLISTSLSMLYEAMRVGGEHGFSPALTFVVLGVCVTIVKQLHDRLKMHDMLLLLGSIFVSLAVFICSA